MKIRNCLPLVLLSFAVACADTLMEPETAGLTGSDPSSPTATEVTQPAAPTAGAHFNLTSGGDGVGPTVTTDRPDYQPGDTVTISGSGWLAGETVELLLEEDPATHDPLVFTSVVDANGDFVNRDFVVEEHDLGVTFALTATGLTSGLTAGAGFTDDNVAGAPVETRESTCTTAQVSFTLGATVCARAGAVSVSPSGGSAPFRIQWFTSANTLLSTTAIAAATNGSYYTSSYTPLAGGTYNVRTCKGSSGACTGGTMFDSVHFTITAPPANNPPVLASIGNKTVAELTLLSFTATATDEDVPSLVFSLAAPASGTYPTGAGITSGGAFTWTPTEAQGPGTYRVKVVVTDDASQTDEEEIQITVTEVNLPPVLTVPADFSTQWGVAILGKQASATDPDLPANTLSFSLITPLVTGVSINNGTGVISWTPTSGQIGANTITVRVVDDGSPALADTAAFTITVTERPTSLVYDGKLAGQYSDKDTLSATLTDNGDGTMNGDPISGATVSFTFDGAAAGSDGTNANGFAFVEYQIPKPDGNYNVTASFAGGSGYAASTDNDNIFDVDPEDVTVEFDANNPGSVPVTGPGGSSVAFQLEVRVQEAYPPEPDENDGAMPGDIALASMTMTLNPILGGSGVSGSCAGAVSGTPPSYAAYKEFTCSFSGVPVETYSVDVAVTGGYYDGSGEDVLTVYDPSLGFVTGGGKFMLEGDRVSFGFSVTNTKGKSAQRGGIVVVRHYADGGRCRLKSKSVTTAITSNTTATLSSSKATNYSCVYADGTTSGKGNLNLTAYVEDNGEPGNGFDRFWVNIGYGDLQMSKTPSIPANAETLTGGNIQVPHKK